MSELNEFVLVEVFHDGQIAVAGQPVDATGYPNSYSAAIAVLSKQAEHPEARLLAKALDHQSGETNWFLVNGRGEVFDAFSGPSSGAQHHTEPTLVTPLDQAVTAPQQTLAAQEEDLEITRQRPRNREQPTLPPEQPSFEPYPAAPPPVAQQVVVPQPVEDPDADLHPTDPAMSEIFRQTIAAPVAPQQPAVSQRPIQQVPTSYPPAQQYPAETAPVAAPSSAATAESPVASRAANRQFVRPPKDRPTQGIRRAVYTASGGTVNLGKSARERDEEELETRISRQLHGSYNTAILSLKGGIGKTSTTVGVGMMLAEYRGDPPCAIDANPDSGDLAERALGELLYQPEGSRTISDVLRNIDSIRTLTELSRYLHHANRLHLIAGEQDPALSDSLTAEEYLKVQSLAAQYYSVILTDCGTGVSHPAMSGILSTASNVVVAAGYAVSGAKRARSTLEWLAGHGYQNLASNAIVVITDKDEVSSRVDKRAIDAELAGHCKQLIAVPHDRGVADGDQISLDTLRPATRRAYKEIAAAIVDGYRAQ